SVRQLGVFGEEHSIAIDRDGEKRRERKDEGMPSSCGQFCSLCGKCGKKLPKALSLPSGILPPGVSAGSYPAEQKDVGASADRSGYKGSQAGDVKTPAHQYGAHGLMERKEYSQVSSEELESFPDKMSGSTSGL
ncbi:MAG: hypothetical protein ACOYIK_04295, partial [Coriobacteriales bacterium]